ncbi:glycine zipper family protein [Ruegeria sp.]|uniref:glycine zipper family protein n=1 Tax=Ruegeria sp. TaxID=1879320 RepID=UPI002317558A|nr:glycine zipper family protein [Ruegeria sp.]MDA7966485.1 glycine zipper family protein [Ruegeria sp.]
MEKIGLTALALLAVSACTPPVQRDLTVDGTRNANYGTDLFQCRTLAENYDNGVVKDGAGYGAVVGGVAGAIEGGSLEGAIAGAVIGTGLGAADASIALSYERRNVLIRCMQGRGHRVVG